ncbi:MAG: L,D-transpeptidase family protein [Methyloceanibacter sp.]|nr:L,D-transpeptidase family protein [Methyloceanibacter sp.]
MHGRSFVAVIIAGGLALVSAVSSAVGAESVAAVEQPAASTSAPATLPSAVTPSPQAATNPAPPAGAANPSPPSAASPTAPAAADPSAQNTAATPAPVDPVVASIRLKLTDPAYRQGVREDVAALQSFYATREAPPLWMTPMGLSAKAHAAIDEIGKADDWGLSAAAFELPPAGDLPATPEAKAVAEIKLDLAILKYARFAHGGRADPSQLSVLLDQKPTLKDPKIVLAEIAASPAPDAYLRSLHPKHEQFERLRQALLKARGDGEDGAKKPRNERDIQRLLINMERWRWMPEDLGSVYVQDNVPEFMLYVVKNGKTIHSDKIVVGQLAYATPIFSADMQTIVFNPEWTVPPTIVRENLLPNLRSGGWFGGGGSILSEHGLQVRYNGRIVDPGSISWSSVNMANIAFTQPPGPTNVLGKLKFLYPNKHTVYMHDTIKRDLFKPAMRANGHNCIRMERPTKLAEVLLAEDKGWEAKQVDDLVAKGNNSPVNLDHPIPVHTTYFTAVVGDDGKVSSFGDIYGLDSKVASAVLGKSVAFAATADDASADSPQAETEAAPAPKRKAPKDEVAGSMQGLFGD